MSVEPNIMIDACATQIEDLARRLSDRSTQRGSHDDSYSWEQATDYVNSRSAILADHPRLTPQQLNKRIRGVEGYQGPGGSWLSHSWRVYEVWPEIFCLKTKKLSYLHYKSIANSTVPDKPALRAWAEEKQPTQAELREKIKELTGDERTLLGFRLMTTNLWRFASSDGADDQGFDGGISNDVVANLLHYFTDPGDVVVDPFAGSGRTKTMVDTLPYFSADWEDRKAHHHGGPRKVLMSDIAPKLPAIQQADAREHIPFDSADFILLDPPYWRIAEGKYDHMGETIGEWFNGLVAVGMNCQSILNNDGMVALALDDFLRSKQTVSLITLGVRAMEEAGFRHAMSIYNNYNNACSSMGALGQWRAMKARLPVNGVKVINIFCKKEEN